MGGIAFGRVDGRSHARRIRWGCLLDVHSVTSRRNRRSVDTAPDHLERYLRFAEHLGVPEAQHANSVLRERAIAMLVIPALFLAGVSAAVDLDRQTYLRAVEIDDETCDRVLAAKPHAELLAAELSP